MFVPYSASIHYPTAEEIAKAILDEKEKRDKERAMQKLIAKKERDEEKELEKTATELMNELFADAAKQKINARKKDK